jgi:DMSO/TMAO reductase YedYZ molybdopterin-dependent catalytic subunit
MAYKPRKSVQAHKPKLGGEAKEILHEAGGRLDSASRRVFMKQVLSLGGLSMVTGVALTNGAAVEKVLARMSRFNDDVQAKLLNPKDLAPEYGLKDLTVPFPFNAFYGPEMAPVVAEDTYRLELAGLIRDKAPWTLEQLRSLPQTSQITRHICVEGWSAIGRWGGVRFSDFLQMVGTDLTAKYIGFRCADDYYTSIDMATALHPQTLLTLTFGPDLQPLPREYGFPMKLRMPTKLGFKNPKHIMAMMVTNVNPGGYWEDQGYNWFSGS